MNLIYAIGSIGPFASRVFLPALLTALLLRFGGHLPVVGHWGILAHVQHTPIWLTSNPCLLTLAVLSALEIFGQKNPEIRTGLHEFDVWLKPALAALSSAGVISASDAGFISGAAHHAAFFSVAIPLIAALGTLRVAHARKSVVLAVFDHVDGTHFDQLLSWLEDAWASFGIFLLLILPVLMLVMVGLATAVLFLLRRRVRRLEESSRVACARCTAQIYPCALSCPKCRRPVQQPVAIGWLGQSLDYPASDLEDQKYRLVEKRRCGACATHLKARDPHQHCPACQSLLFNDLDFAQGYMDYIGRRMPIVLGVTFLLSLVPIVGLIAGVIYYRMAVVLPFSQYLPMGRRFLLRWGIRLLFLVLIFFQLVPLLGGFVGPLMALISYAAYRSSFASTVASPLQPEKIMAAPAGA